MTARGKVNPAWLLAAFLFVIFCFGGWMTFRSFLRSRSDGPGGSGDTVARSTQVTPEVAGLPAQVAAQYAADGAELRVQLAAGKAAYAAGNYADAVTALRTVIALSNYDSATQTAFFLLGNIYDDLGQFADAAFCQDQALRCRPPLAAAWHNLALTELHRGDLNAALAAAKQAVLLAPADPDHRALLAVAYDRSGEHDEALKAARHSVASDSRSALRLLNLALLSARDRSETTASAAPGLLAQARTAPGTPATRRRAAEEYALHLLDNNQPAEAVTALAAALALAPGDARLLHNYGLALIRAELWTEAINALRLAHAAAPTYAPTLYALADALDKRGLRREAIAATKRGLELDPENTARYYQLALLFIGQNEDESARLTLEQILAIGAPNELKLNVQVELAMLASRRGEHAHALALMRTAAALAPQAPWVQFNRGLFAWLADDKTAAYRDLDSALSGEPRQSKLAPDFARTRADLLFRDRRYADAIPAYTRLIGINAASVHGFAQLGWLHQQRRELAIAAEEYRRALALNPNPPLTYLLTLNLATVLAESGNRGAALEKLHAAIAMAPDRYEAYHNAALVSSALGHADEAMAFISVAARLAPTAAAVPLARGFLLWNKGLRAEAAAAWEQAAALDPALLPARYNLNYYRRLAAPPLTATRTEEYR